MPVNTLGAAVGAFATTWAILPAVGLDQGLRIGAAMNGLCMALDPAFPFAGSGATWTHVDDGPAHDAGTALDARLPFTVWIVIYADFRVCRSVPGNRVVQAPQRHGEGDSFHIGHLTRRST